MRRPDVVARIIVAAGRRRGEESEDLRDSFRSRVSSVLESVGGNGISFLRRDPAQRASGLGMVT